jgi:hypothetical protein
VQTLSRLLGRKFSGDETPFDELPIEEQEQILADEKKARVEFHAKQVRNGPVNWRTITAGQQRRAAARSQKGSIRKANARHRRTFIAKRLDTAVLRGHLQAAGVVEYHDPAFEVPSSTKANALMALVSKYGKRDEHGNLDFDAAGHEQLVIDALEAAKNDYLERVGA